MTWNLPPGCTDKDIDDNAPQDESWLQQDGESIDEPTDEGMSTP